MSGRAATAPPVTKKRIGWKKDGVVVADSRQLTAASAVGRVFVKVETC